MAGKQMTLTRTGQAYVVEDWFDRVFGQSWTLTNVGNYAVGQYALRQARDDTLPFDDDVVYGKVDGLGVVAHVTELS